MARTWQTSCRITLKLSLVLDFYSTLSMLSHVSQSYLQIVAPNYVDKAKHCLREGEGGEGVRSES